MDKIIYILFFLFMGFTSCTKKVTLDLPSEAGKLVPNVIFNNNDPMVVYMTETVHPIDTLYNTANPKMLLILNEDGQFKEIISYNPSSTLYEAATIPQPLKTYELLVKSGNNQPVAVSASCKMPASIKLKNISMIDSVKQIGSEYYGQLTFTMDDSPEENVYRLNIYYFNTSIAKYVPMQYTTDDELLNDTTIAGEENIRYFTDTKFNGQSHEFKVWVKSGSYYSFNNRNDILIETASLSSPFFQYMQSLKEYTKAINPRNPLNNPVQLYSNTSNNLGIFAGYVISRDTIR